MRVLFQMSQTDSGHLLDAPHASKLGTNRALFFSEEQNRLEKFRPYGLPPDDLLDRVRASFLRRPTPARVPDGGDGHGRESRKICHMIISLK